MSEALGDIDDFLECCAQQAWFYDEGLIDLQTAVDNLQFLAARWGLIDLYGQDAIQQIISFVPPIPSSNYADEILRRWELADPRDRWKYTGEAVPEEALSEPATRPRRAGPPQSTIDAFKYVVGLGDAEYLARWLRDHSDVAPALLKQLPEAA